MRIGLIEGKKWRLKKIYAHLRGHILSAPFAGLEHTQIWSLNVKTKLPLLKDHLLFQSLEKDGQEWLRGESAIGAAQWRGLLELELTHTGALVLSENRKEGGTEGRAGSQEVQINELLVGD